VVRPATPQFRGPALRSRTPLPETLVVARTPCQRARMTSMRPTTDGSPAAPTMRAWAVLAPGPVDRGPLRAVERPVPTPGPGEVRVAVSVCGVCRTDLHVAEGDLDPHRPGVVPGHEIVGTVAAQGPGSTRFALGDRVGIAWLRATCGSCRFCRRGDENLCMAPRFTGWDADGGYAEHAVVDERYAYAIPSAFTDDEAAPLLCAGIIGYRALRRASLPPGGRLGIYGFGGSAHLAAQVAVFEGATVHVLTRSAEAQQLALDLGAASVGGAYDAPPEPLDAAILFAPVGDLVPVALAALDRGGTLAIAGIHLSDVPTLDYQRHLFQERQVRSVTANTRRDGEEFLAIAARIPIRPQTVAYPFDRADAALADLAHDRVTGAAVLHIAR
jgi:alcohol dehydrogenase, propanol-preferring